MLSITEILKARARIYQQIRVFFARRDFLEVDTELLSDYTNSDAHIQSIQARVSNRRQYLQTSPEFAMKRLLVAGSGSIYQICHAFRDEEQGRRHRAEFTLLEWYGVGYDYWKLMDQMEELIQFLLEETQPFRRVSYYDCFQQSLGLDLRLADLAQCRDAVQQRIAGIDVATLGRDDCLDLLISQVVSKQFQGFVFVYDYPASQASLARLKAEDDQLAERFELFYNDMELANGFSELTDPDEQRQRFESDNLRRQQSGLETCDMDAEFLSALEAGLPACAGVALGLERLMMVMLQLTEINQLKAP
jgi:lysyl-tRNA synthetase class 2